MGELTLHPMDNDPGGVGPQTVKCPKCKAAFKFYAYNIDQNTAEYIISKATEALGESCPDHVDKFIY